MSDLWFTRPDIEAKNENLKRSQAGYTGELWLFLRRLLHDWLLMHKIITQAREQAEFIREHGDEISQNAARAILTIIEKGEA